jgi:thiamine-monophosphate kinase
MKLTRLGELFLLEQLRKSFKKKSENILVGIGDDAAVIKPLDKNLLVTTDMMVEKIHFNLNYITSYQLGFKLISINVSDIYAMGGYPLYVLLNIALKRDTDIIFFNILLDGIQDALKKYNTILVGGDLSNTNTDMILSATIIGYSKNYIGRKGAVKGDKIYVTGYLGDSACGFELLKKIKNLVPPSLHQGRKQGRSEFGFSNSKIQTFKIGIFLGYSRTIAQETSYACGAKPENFQGRDIYD